MPPCFALKNSRHAHHVLLGGNRGSGFGATIIGGGLTRQPPLMTRGSRPTASRSNAVPVAATMDFRNIRNERSRRPENVDGPFYVDHTCIDCDTCRWMAPDTFGRVGPQSAAVSQPRDNPGRVQALKALLSCPTYSIHVTDRSPEELREAQNGLPARVPGVPYMPYESSISSTTTATSAAATAIPDGNDDSAAAAVINGSDGKMTATSGPGVYYTGWASEKSVAGCAYLIVRPHGNILIDSPRFNSTLARRIKELGGAKYMFLTHRDDVGEHEAWSKALGAARILHTQEVNEMQGTDKVEIKLTGDGPWVINAAGAVVPAADDPTAADSADVTFIFTPGHTEGHVCLYYAPYKTLFSGDHLASTSGAMEAAPEDRLFIYTDFNWYSVPEQLCSVAKLLQYDWLHVLPAHGRRAHLRDAAARLAAVHDLLDEHGVAAASCGTKKPVPAGVTSQQ